MGTLFEYKVKLSKNEAKVPIKLKTPFVVAGAVVHTKTNLPDSVVFLVHRVWNTRIFDNAIVIAEYYNL